jgi:general secretion pathway protein K
MLTRLRFFRNDQGIALVTVLMATALVAILAVGMTSAQQLNIRRTTNLLEGDQALLMAQGLEEWAVQLLLRDRQNGNNDHLGEDWAMGLIPTSVENGSISGLIVDLQGRINLNNLRANNETTNSQTQDILERIFNTCEVENAYNTVQALADWLDSDSETRPGGAEDQAYLLRQPAYRASNRLMVSPTELMLVEGITPGNYQCLADHIATLRVATMININTANAMVIAALVDTITLAEAKEIIRDRPDSGYANEAAFLAHPALAGTGMNSDGIALVSNFFLVQGDAFFGNAEIHLNTVLARQSATVEILGRSVGTY